MVEDWERVEHVIGRPLRRLRLEGLSISGGLQLARLRRQLGLWSPL